MNRIDEILLVVEDEEQGRRINVEALRSLGDTVQHAAQAEDALSILETQPAIKLMLTDIVMPGMNGRDLAGQVRRMKPEIRILLATGYEREQVDEKQRRRTSRSDGLLGRDLVQRIRHSGCSLGAAVQACGCHASGYRLPYVDGRRVDMNERPKRGS